MAEAINSPLVGRDIDLVLTPLYSDDDKGEPVLVTVLHIDPARLTFREVEGRYRTQVEVVGNLLNASGDTVDGFRYVAPLDLPPEEYKEVLKRGCSRRGGSE